MTTGTQFALVIAVFGGLGLLLSIGYNLKRIATALETIAASSTRPE